MGANPLGNMQEGDSGLRSITVHNAMMEMYRWWKTHRGRDGPTLKQVVRQTGIVLVANESGYDRERFDVLGISNVFPGPDDNLPAFENGPVLDGITPDIDDHVGKFAILQEPAVDEAIVPAVVSGVTVAKVDITDEDHGFAEIEDAEAGNLISGNSGLATILWKESGTGVKWAVIRIGGGDGVSMKWGKLDAAMDGDDPDGTVTVSIWDWNSGGTAWEDTGDNQTDVYPPFLLGAGKILGSGIRVLIAKIGAKWYVIAAACD